MQPTHFDKTFERWQKNGKMLRRLNHITDQLYEVEFVKSEIEHTEPIIVELFILQFAKQRMLQLYYNFLRKVL